MAGKDAFIGLPSHQVEFVGVDGVAITETRNDYCEANRRFRRRHRHHENTITCPSIDPR